MLALDQAYADEFADPPSCVVCGSANVNALFGRVVSPVNGPALMCCECGPVHAAAYEAGRRAA